MTPPVTELSALAVLQPQDIFDISSSFRLMDSSPDRHEKREKAIVRKIRIAGCFIILKLNFKGKIKTS
jgi:hypothetical protein